jgi:dCTP deaminase
LKPVSPPLTVYAASSPPIVNVTHALRTLMILTGEEIKAQLGKNIVIDPFDPAKLNPNSYNLSLHDELLVYEEIVLDVRRPNRYRRYVIPPEGMVLQPHQLYLGRTIERTETHNLVPMLEGRSSIGRLGLFVHVSAGFGDVGFKGYWTLELFAIHPIRIYPGLSICQIFYHTLMGEVSEYRNGKYQNNEDIQPSLFFKELQVSPKDPQMRLAFGQEMLE